MTTSADIFSLVKAALTTPCEGRMPTDADERVRSPGDLPTQSDDYPLIKLRLMAETKQSIGRDTVIFTTIAIIRLVGEVSEPAVIGDVNTSKAEANLWRLERQAEVAIINSYPLFREIQQLVSVQTQLTYLGEKQVTHLAGIQSDYTFEFIESGEDFAEIETTDIVAPAHFTITNYPPIGATPEPVE